MLSRGKAFEILIKRMLMNVGFSEVYSDGVYIFDGTAGQMIQGLGEAHNADVLLQPPVQIPFYIPTRILVECKDYIHPVGLNTIRSALGLREDINHFEVVDVNVLKNRKSTRRPKNSVYEYTRYFYQVAVASMSGFTKQAQEFAATHRISLISLSNMPFWASFNESFNSVKWTNDYGEIENLADEIGKRMAVAITNNGQMLFLYNERKEDSVDFGDFYEIYWQDTQSLWRLESGNHRYVFELPSKIREIWLQQSSINELRMNALYCKAEFLSNMIVYYFGDYKPAIKMISIDKRWFNEALDRITGNK